MAKLIITTIIWAFSFSLIGQYISGKIDIYFAIIIRFTLGAAVLLPFFNWKHFKSLIAVKLMVIGAIQIGLMYIAYFNSFAYLSVPEVALFTIFTPIYITLLDNIIKKRITIHFILTSALAILGALIIKWSKVDNNFIIGFLLVQAANICFASGQILYKTTMNKEENRCIDNKSVFFLFYIGSLIPIIPLFLMRIDSVSLPTTPIQYTVLAWLGIVASGLGYLLWNAGARETNTGFLAVMNNAVIPLAILVNLILWNGQIDYIKFTIGSSVIVIALILNQKLARAKSIVKEF
jgi:carboxylate/amino acid/amine transporter